MYRVAIAQVLAREAGLPTIRRRGRICKIVHIFELRFHKL